MSAVPGPVYGLEVPPGEILIPASMDFPASFRITMAALDPTEEPEADEEGNVPAVPRATLRLVKRAFPGLDDEDEDDEIDDEYMKALLAASDDDDDEDEEEEANGGPSDPAKAKKQKQAAAIKKLLEATQDDEDEDEDEDMEDAKPNGVKSKAKGKGKAKAVEEDDEDEEDDEEEDDEDDDDSDDGADLENFVVCTLDTERNYQQPLDITVNHGEKVFFVVTGTHTVYLTGNYIMDDEDDYDSEDDEEDYDFDPEELDYAMGEDASDDESDELDDVEDPRVTEVDSEEDEAPKLVESKKGKNKRAAEEAEGLDEMIAKASDSKKQQKKLKNNKGEAVAAEEGKKDKKVQFAKNLEQGPTGSGKQAGKPATGVKVVQGVTLDDRTIGKGRTVKSGDTVGVRYIGKLANGQQFDANKKGKPFSFKVGKGQVIKGWDVGVVGMAIGGERRLTIPAHLGYGSRGMPGIPANSQLTFDVKLLEIK
ncbi:FKBP-type peptidyl-prolyl isomerase [Pochonia chlamydosporia 170]|uniref:FK506-binding protein n=1 Tax=Pochonia chlamydosporia 170 TaxID=1380566 RepID=A0A179G4D8_METCM|nr:FKBP-type peptidyl-prolyl isomerase [Pochonia chlamydosporia 170]OAQ72716.1 FKBP-type peptidyl-prolyl isomerase [Pochonia chlamydosporia 170]